MGGGIMGRREDFASLINSTRPEGAETLLDLGCSDGQKIAHIGAGLKITGVEGCSQTAFAAAEILHRAVNMDYRNFLAGCQNESYDWITMLDTLEHVTKKDAREVMRNLKRVARMGFTLYVPEGAVGDNPWDEGYNRHLAHWFMNDWASFDVNVMVLPDEHGAGKNAFLVTWRRNP